MAAEGFAVTPYIGTVFFRTCSLYRVKTEKDRIALLRKLVARHKAKYIAHPEEFLQGKNVWRLRKDSSNGMLQN